MTRFGFRATAAVVCVALATCGAAAQSRRSDSKLERAVEVAKDFARTARDIRAQILDEPDERSFLDVIAGLDLDAVAPLDDRDAEWADADAATYAAPRSRTPRANFPFRAERPVYQFIAYFTRGAGKSAMQTGLHRSGLYRSLAERIFREEGVPTDLVWLAQVESLWKPWALSSASAKGLWQFIPSTGARFGLGRTYWVDERADPNESTRAAARYLRSLHRRFGDWHLALAAYNAGESGVSRAVERGGRKDFWYLYRRGLLPRETRNYVPAILATVMIAKNPERYGVRSSAAAPWRYDTVSVTSQTGLRNVADICGTSLADVWQHNPDLRRGVTPPGRYTLRLPPGARARFLAAYQP